VTVDKRREPRAAGRIVCKTDYLVGKDGRCRVLTTIPGEITQSVGATALGVASRPGRGDMRAENPLINDPFARVFVNAAGDGMWSITRDPRATRQGGDLEPDIRARMALMIDFMATRTAFLRVSSFWARRTPAFARW